MLADLNRQPAIISKGYIYSTLLFIFKIAEGCDKHCTYCIIPKLRGKYRSRAMDELTDEASYLASNGVKELILVAQETTLYGVDLYGKSTAGTSERLCKISVLSGYLTVLLSEEITDELIDTISSEPKICNYLDIPIQHCSDRILKHGKKSNKEDIINIVKSLERIPILF